MHHDAEESSTKTTYFKQFKKPNKRCTVAQKKALVDYMSTHTRLARYECDAATADIEWQRLAYTLNRSGTVKTVNAWKVTWRDLRRKAAKDQEEALATNTSINEISGRIRAIMADSDEDLIGTTSNVYSSPTLPKSINSPVEESDQDEDFETSVMTVTEESLVQTIAAPTEDMEAQARSSPASELESVQGPPESSSDSSPCTSPTPTNKTRCTQDQINSLVDCMAINTSMAFGRQNTPKKAEDWKRLRQFLNRMGPAKRTVAWQKTWRDLKRSAVISDKTKSPWIKPTTKKILKMIEAYTQKLRDEPNEHSADDADLFLPPEHPYFHRAPSKSPLSEYLLLPDVDRSKIRVPGKHSPFKMSPARRSSSRVLLVDNSTRETSPAFLHNESEHDSDTYSQGFQKSRKIKKMRCTNAQKFAIVDYMAQHPSLAASRASAGDYYAKWRQLSKYLNKIGTAKTTASWKRTWRELKKNARYNRACNPKWAEINQRILDICEKAANIKSQAESVNKPAEDDEPCPTDDMPLLSLRRQSSHTEPQTPPEVLCEEDRSNDNTEPSQDRKNQSRRSSEVSPERHGSMSPQQRSEPASPVQTKKERSQQPIDQKSKNARCTPSQINALMNYMAKHPSLAKAKCLYMPKGRDPWYNEWRHLTSYLNSLNKMGPAKSTTGWKCTWRSLCLNARRKKSKQCPSYERVYKKVLKILGKDQHNEGAAVTKVETIEDYDSFQTETGPNPAEYSQSHSSEHSIVIVEGLPLKYEKHNTQEYRNRNIPVSSKHSSSQALNRSDRMSPIQRGSRMSPVRISDKVSPGRRSSDRMSPGCSEVSVHRLSRTSPVMDSHGTLVDVENQLSSSRERWGLKPKKIRCSNGQLRALADYMIAHPGLATDKYIDHREPAWVRLTNYLNDIGPARKRTEAWKRTWRDIKNGVRARVRSNQRSGCLESFREEKVLKLIGMSSPDRKNSVQSDDDHMDEEYVVPEPEVILTPHAPSPHAPQYDLTEIFAQSSPGHDGAAESETDGHTDRERDNAEIEENFATTTNSLLRSVLEEVRRGNELHIEQNGYLKEILKQLRTQTCTHATRHTDRDSPINHGSNSHEPKQEVLENSLEGRVEAEDNASQCNDVTDSNNEIPAKSSPVIRPVSLSSLTNSIMQSNERVNVQSILQGKIKPATPKGKLIRLKDGTMVLMPENMKIQTTPNHDKSTENQKSEEKQKLEENENESWRLKTRGVNEC